MVAIVQILEGDARLRDAAEDLLLGKTTWLRGLGGGSFS